MTIRNVGLAAGIGVFAAAGSLVAAPLATAPLGTGETTVASGSVRLVDQATDLPAPQGMVLPPGAVWPPGAVELPGTGLPMAPLPPGVVLPPEVPQMVQQGMAMLQSPPPNVPNEVCRFNTVRVPCP